jgi:aldose 1-epimerase
VLAPSGRQYLLAGPGGQQAVVVEVGGGLREYGSGGRPVLDGYAEGELCSGGRGQVLAPWPNRVGDGRYAWAGRDFQLPLTEVEHGNAIHGLVRWASWSLAESSAARVLLAHRLPPQPGWPWPLDLTVAYSLTPSGLEVTLGAENLGSDPCPWGAGFHPYLAAFGGLADQSQLQVPAAAYYRSDERGLPVGIEPVAGGPVDFRSGRPIGPAHLDVAFTDLERDSSGRATVELADPAGGGRTQLWVDPSWTHLMVFTGDTLGEVGRRRRGVAVEPMTAPPDMLRSGTGRIVLEPGERWQGSWGIAPGSLL